MRPILFSLLFLGFGLLPSRCSGFCARGGYVGALARGRRGGGFFLRELSRAVDVLPEGSNLCFEILDALDTFVVDCCQSRNYDDQTCYNCQSFHTSF